jgi:hypothetical protein
MLFYPAFSVGFILNLHDCDYVLCKQYGKSSSIVPEYLSKTLDSLILLHIETSIRS